VSTFSDSFGTFSDFARHLWSSSSGSFGAIDAYQDKEAAVVAVDVPGVELSDLELTAEASTLTIKVARNQRVPQGAQVVASERPQGSLTRRLSVSESLDLDRVQARYDRGVLYLRIPLGETARPRRIEVGSSQAGAIDVGSQPTTAASG
jgi:HSP20 family protein